MNFNQYIQFRALAMKAHIQGQSMNSESMEKQISKLSESGSPDFKTVCAPISIELFDRLDRTLSMLDISKRSFIEAAIIHALNQTDLIADEVDIFEGLPPSEGQ